jgi:MFS family permease
MNMQLMPARTIVGVGGGITKVAAPALLHEIAHPRLRATMGTLYYGFYHLGGTVSAIMCSEPLLLVLPVIPV